MPRRPESTYVTLYVTVHEAGKGQPQLPWDFVLVGRDNKLYEHMYGVTLDGREHAIEAVAGAGALAVFRVPATALPGVVEFKVPVGRE